MSASMCASRERVVGMLASNFRERPAAIGMVDRNAVVEIFVSREQDTWTIVASDPDGNSCIISAGEGWQQTPAETVEEQV